MRFSFVFGLSVELISMNREHFAPGCPGLQYGITHLRVVGGVTNNTVIALKLNGIHAEGNIAFLKATVFYSTYNVFYIIRKPWGLKSNKERRGHVLQGDRVCVSS